MQYGAVCCCVLQFFVAVDGYVITFFGGSLRCIYVRVIIELRDIQGGADPSDALSL